MYLLTIPVCCKSAVVMGTELVDDIVYTDNYQGLVFYRPKNNVETDIGLEYYHWYYFDEYEQTGVRYCAVKMGTFTPDY